MNAVVQWPGTPDTHHPIHNVEFQIGDGEQSFSLASQSKFFDHFFYKLCVYCGVYVDF